MDYTYVFYKNPQEHREWLVKNIQGYKDAGLYYHAAKFKRELEELDAENSPAETSELKVSDETREFFKEDIERIKPAFEKMIKSSHGEEVNE